MTTFKLNTGAVMPAVGLGTWQAEPGEVRAAVSCALQSGYRLVDTAYCYGNEAEVGAGLRDAFAAGVRRDDVVVMAKVWATYNTRVAEGLAKSLARLGLDYVDVFLVHWPVLLNPDGNDDRFPTRADGTRDVVRGWDHVEAWRQMEALLATGKVKAIGVCNYSKRYLDELLAHAAVVPAVNQIENHPALPQHDIVDACRAHGIHVVAYSPLGSSGSPLLSAAPVAAVAARRGVGPATVLLSYHVARGCSVLAKSVAPARIRANLETVALAPDDVRLLDEYAAAQGPTRYVYPPFGIDLGFPDKAAEVHGAEGYGQRRQGTQK